MVKRILSDFAADRIAGPRRLGLKGAISVLSAMFGLTLAWRASAQTNVSLELREALDDTNLVWATSGTRPWRLQFAESHDSVDAAEGGPLQAGIIEEQNGITTSVTGPGRLSFWWKLEDTTCFQLSLLVGTNHLATIGGWTASGPTNWMPQVFTIPPGSQNLTWRFQTLCGDGSSPGRAWLDEVQYTPDAPVLAVLSHNSESLTVEVIGSAGTRVQAEVSTDLVSWAPLPLTQLTLEDGRGVLQAPKSGSKAFYRMVTVP